MTDVDHVPVIVDVDESFWGFEDASFKSDRNPSSYKQINFALLHENTVDFVELINNLPSHLLEKESQLKLIWSNMLYYDSGKCAAAVLDGQTKITEIPLETSMVSLLHQAADFCAPKVTSVLLQRGFSADVRGDFVSRNLKSAPPLHLVMRNLRSHMLGYNFTEEPYVLLPKICQPRVDYRQSLETLRLVALNTREVKREFFNYLKEGKMVEVGALLLVAKSQILSPSTVEGEGEFRSMSEILDFVYDSVKPLKGKEFVEMQNTLKLLEILNKVGDKLAALLRIDFRQTCLANSSALLVASLIEDAGFRVNYICNDFSNTRNETEHYFLKGAIDACEKKIRTSDMLPFWVKEAALTGLGVKPGRKSRFTYPFLAKTLPHVNRVSDASPMSDDLLKKTAPLIKKAFRHRKLLR